MLWSISFAIAAIILLLAFSVCIKRALTKKESKNHIKPINFLMPVCFIATVVIIFPALLTEHKGETADIAKAFILSVRKAIRLIGADEIYQTAFKHLNAVPELLKTPYQLVVLLLQLVTPLLSFGLVLSLFKNLTAYMRYWGAYFKNVYVFAEINNKSLALATDILKKHLNARVVFADIPEKEQGSVSDLIWSARSKGAILFKKDVTAINFGFHSKKRRIYFFTMHENEIINVNHALKLISQYNTRDNTHLYIFSTHVQSELMLSDRSSGLIKVRRIDEVRSLISHFLYEKGDEIFKSAKACPNNEKVISAVIVGMGKRGTEMLKALAWYCQMDGYRIKINAFDSDPLAEERFSALCPELMSAAYNGVRKKGEAEYDITVHSNYNVSTKSFAEAFMKIKDATYVFVSLGSDELNIKTAVQLRMLSERIGNKPLINAVLGNSDAKTALESAVNSAGQAYEIKFIGDVSSFYSEKVIMDSKAEDDAFLRHCAYCNGDKNKEEDFWRYEYCYRSSMASAIHAEARKKCGIQGSWKKEEELTDSEREIIESLEHRRWNAYMRAEGYVYSGSTEKSSRNDLAKMHHNLVVYSELEETDKRKDSLVAGNIMQED